MGCSLYENVLICEQTVSSPESEFYFNENFKIAKLNEDISLLGCPWPLSARMDM